VVWLASTKPCLLLRLRFEESFGGFVGVNLPLRPSVSANHKRTIAIGSAPHQPPFGCLLWSSFSVTSFPSNSEPRPPVSMCLFPSYVGPKTWEGLGSYVQQSIVHSTETNWDYSVSCYVSFFWGKRMESVPSFCLAFPLTLINRTSKGDY
jgi:hypothetical protein